MDFGVKFQGREDTGFEKNFEIRLYPDKTVVQAFGYNRISKNLLVYIHHLANRLDDARLVG
ncbi:MAG: hypothetical protein RL206_442 [Bacteroidota bacterium]